MQDLITAFRGFFTDYAAHPAIIDPRKNATYTYAVIEDLSSRLATVLRGKVRPGGTVAFLMHNEVEIVLAYLACFQLQLVAVPINPSLHPNEVHHVLALTAPDVLITTWALMDKFGPIEVPCLPLGDKEEYSIAALKQEERVSDDFFGAMRSDFLALIMFTSGSTGLPKAIPFPFSRLVNSVLSLKETSFFGCYGRFYNVLPMSYIGGIHQLLCYFLTGSTYILDEAFSPRSSYRYWDTVLKYKADVLWLTPTMASALLAIGLEDEALRPRIAAQVKRAVIAMGAIADDVKERFEKTFGIRLQKLLGITETLLVCHWNDQLDMPIGSVGKALPQVMVEIAGENEEPLAPGKEGEIRIGGPWVMEGYWNQPDLDALSFDKKHFFRTGDLGRMDEQGNVFITGRIKDMIKCGGLNVSPAEIEATLVAFPGIKEAAVLGVPDEFYGEKIIAFVSLQPGAHADAAQVIQHCRRELTAQKVPSEVQMIEQFPMNAVGKIDKRALKAALQARKV